MARQPEKSPKEPPQRSLDMVVAVWVPDWPVLALSRHHGREATEPVAVMASGRVQAASAQARAEGVRAGMRRRTAQEMCPHLVVLPADPPVVAAAFNSVAAAVEQVVARPVVARPGMMWARVPADTPTAIEQTLAALVDSVAQRDGAESNAGAAGNVLAAVAAARVGDIVPPDDTAQYVAALPVGAVLDLVDGEQRRSALTELVAMLSRLGIDTVGALLALPPGAIRDRFGPLGEWICRVATEPVRPHTPWFAPRQWLRRAPIDPPAWRGDTVGFIADAPARALHADLVQAHCTCAVVAIHLVTDAGDQMVRRWQGDVGVLGGLEPRDIVERVRWQVDGWLAREQAGRSGDDPAPAPVVEVVIEAEDVIEMPGVGEPLWGADNGQMRRRQRVVDRVHGLLGDGGIFTPIAQGGRVPRDTVALVPWGRVPNFERPVDRPWPGRLPHPDPPTIPPTDIPVVLLGASGQVVMVDRRLRVDPAPALLQEGESVRSEVIGWAGPWPVVERWWNADTSRSAAYVQVVLADGRGMLLATSRGQWWCEGCYD